MKLIAHRGNTTGPELEFENTLDYMKSALHLEYDVECDIVDYKGKLYFGHDEPQEEVDWTFLTNSNVWAHAKTITALEILSKTNVHYFWHQNDLLTITNKGYIWCYPNTFVQSEKAVWLELLDCPINKNFRKIYAVCSDNVNNLKEYIK